jgi:dienelactone hydrolase
MAKRLLNQGAGTVSGGSSALLPLGNSNDPSAFTLYFPDGAKSGESFPLLTFGNGTFCSPTFYDELIGFIVSYGYVVIATNTSNTGSGAEMLKAVEWVLAENDKADSPIHGMVDGDHIGALGHSQGGAGTAQVGADPRIDAIAPLSGAIMGDAGGAKILCPTFYTLTENDVVGPDAYRQAYDSTPTPSVLGVTAGGDHDDYTDKADDPGLPGLTSNDGLRTRPAIVAWFEWQLKGKTALKTLFVGTDCGFCRDSNWKTFESKGF